MRGPLTDTLVELLSIPSVTGREGPLCDAVEARLRRRFPPASVVRVGNSVAGGALANDGRPTLALFGHLDTVPGDAGPPQVDGDRVVGLGASDMKSGLAVMLELADRMPDDAPVRLLVAFYDQEETDYDKSGLPALLEAAPALSQADLGMCLEPTDGHLHLGCVGSLHARLRVRGRRAHSARPWQGDNAVYKALPLLRDLAEIAPREVERAGLVFREVTTVTLASAGSGRNVVPEMLEINVNIRFAPGRTAAQAEAELNDLVAGRADVEIVDRAPSAPVCADNPLLSPLVSHPELQVLPKQAWTDVARLAEAGIDAANFGPGISAQAHQAGEFCELPALVQAYERLRALVLALP